MKILIIDDTPNKIKNLEKTIKEYSSDFIIEKRESYQTGYNALKSDSFDLVLLDMSIPLYDLEGNVEPLGGKFFLIEMERIGIDTNVIVVTQFPNFGAGKSQLTLDELNADIKQYKNYKRTIFYDSKNTKWKIELINYIKSLKVK